ncbi:MAG: hypothetical protein V8S34_07195 [Lawsonibacter sp.]
MGRLPITLRRETWREYDLTSVPLNREAAQTLLQDRLLRLSGTDLIGPEGELVTADYSAQMEGDSMKMTLVAECREEIGKERETGAVTDGPEPEENGKTGRPGEKHLKRAEKEHILNLYPVCGRKIAPWKRGQTSWLQKRSN